MQRSTGSLLYLWTRSGGNNYFSVTEGQTYTFSILVAQNSDSFDLNYAYMRRDDGSQISLATTGNPTRYRVSKTKVGEVFGRSVYKYIFTFQSPFTANDTFMFFGVSDATESSRGIYFSEWKLEEGAEATPYYDEYASKNDLISDINDDASGVNIAADKINLSGYATFSSLSTAGSSTIHGDNITTGRLTSSNGRTTFNLNTGSLTMSNTNFELGGGATIQFLNSGNRIVYARKDPNSTSTRYAGIGVGINYNSRFPYAYLGTTAGGSGALDASDDQNFTGFITNTN